MALQQAATDPVTGAIDMDLIQTGVSASERVARARLAQEIKALLLGARRSPGSASVTWRMQTPALLGLQVMLCIALDCRPIPAIQRLYNLHIVWAHR